MLHTVCSFVHLSVDNSLNALFKVMAVMFEPLHQTQMIPLGWKKGKRKEKENQDPLLL